MLLHWEAQKNIFELLSNFCKFLVEQSSTADCWLYLKVSTEAVSGAVVVLQDGESVRPPSVGALTPQARADRGAAQTPGHQGHVALLHLQWSDIEFPVMFILTDKVENKNKFF